MKTRILSIVALLLMAVSGAWADDTYTVQLKANNGNTKTVENVVLPHQFRCRYVSEDGELDQIIKGLYGLSNGYCTGNMNSSDNEKVTCGTSGNDQYFTISAPFEGTVTVTGQYSLDDDEGNEMAYSLEISIPGYTAPAAAIFAIDTDGTTQDFGSVEADATAQKTFTVTNNGNATLNVSFAATGDFTVTDPASSRKFRLTDNLGWGTGYAYAWDSKGKALLGEWPGTACGKTTNDMNDTQFVVAVPNDAVGVVVNNGNGAQTVDITNFTQGYWMDGSKDGSGHYKVEGWTGDGATEETPAVLTVAAGESETFTVAMNTATLGSKSGNITLSFDAKNATSFTIPCTGETVAPATKYDLTLADGSSDHGTVAFTVGGNAATQAKKDDVVTVTVTPNEGYSAKDETVRAYTGWESAGARRMNRAGENPEMIKDITVTPGENNTWTFTMPESDVMVEVTYAAVVDKTALNTAITEAETYYNSISESNPEAATTLQAAINAAKAVKDNADATQAEVDDAKTTLDAAVNTAKQAVLTEAKNKLAEDITAAETYYESIKDDYSDAATALKAAIDAAKGVKDNADATQEQVDDAIAALAAAKTTAENAVLTEAKTALNNAITEAEAYYNSIMSESNLKATDLQNAISDAQAVKNSDNPTVLDVEVATRVLINALDAAKADDALKRIAVTIPAKSYVTRFDADKRQIETAVAGVSLYTVKSVTNTEVELTSELNVVAAEMPYLIYNDNDEEKTINLIVSSSDADNVTVAAEFKGTLVDKTFTGEDMQEADHYVLSNGHNFVWVKDAGTLAGGKCWIELTKAAGARRLSIVAGGEATGIDLAPVLTEGEGAWYDLNGRRVVNPTKKGLYIMNGKKYVVK